MYKLNYLVTGTGRCGTVFLAKFLTSVGISCGHETVFLYDGFDRAKDRLNGRIPLSLSRVAKDSTGQNENTWFPHGIVNIEADSSYMAAPFIDDHLFDNVAIIHAVRNPIQVINSFVDAFGYFRDSCMHSHDEKRYHQFIYRHVPAVLQYTNPVDRAAAYYIEWNNMIEHKSKNRKYFRFNLNNQKFDKLFKFLGMERPASFCNRRLNGKAGPRHKYHSISQIPDPTLRDKIAKIQAKYCYIKI